VGTKYQGTEEQKLALDAFIKLSRSTDRLTGALREQNPLPGRLTVSQLGVLEALLHLGPLDQQQLSRKILKTKGNLSLVVENLEKAGLVDRRRVAEDRRRLMVRLTGKGEELIGDIFPSHAQAITKLMSVLSPEEQKKLGILCRKLGLGIEERFRRSP
jgi:MarR family 2-MHQ and catechol resistance regulon transcriptional repressor